MHCKLAVVGARPSGTLRLRYTVIHISSSGKLIEFEVTAIHISTSSVLQVLHLHDTSTADADHPILSGFGCRLRLNFFFKRLAAQSTKKKLPLIPPHFWEFRFLA